ncbi:unnamed protein product [Urochloa humidicola]
MALTASSTGLFMLCFASLILVSMFGESSGAHDAGRKMSPGWVAEEQDPPTYTPAVPSYTPTVPSYTPTVPTYTPNNPYPPAYGTPP